MKSKFLNLLSLISILFLAGGCALPSDPVKENPINKTYQGAINLQNMELPLPEGEWSVIGCSYAFDQKYIEIVLLNKTNLELIDIIRNSFENNSYEYFPSKYLERDNLHYKEVKNNMGLDQDGWLINHVRLAHGSDDRPAEKEAYSYLVKNGYSIPGNHISIYHRFTGGMLHPEKYFSYNYYINPEKDGFAPPEESSWGSSDWNPGKYNNDPAKVEYIEKLKIFGAKQHENLKLAFKRK